MIDSTKTDGAMIRERIKSREAKIATWEADKQTIQSRIDQYRRMVERDREYLKDAPNEEI